MSTPPSSWRALALGAAAMALLTVMDAVAKALAADLGTLQITGLRFALTALLAAVVAVLTRARWPTRAQWPAHAGRAALMLLATACFFHALGRLPLVTVFALSLTAPLCMAALGAVLLGEPLARGTRAALGLGAAGAAVVVAGVWRGLPGAVGVSEDTDLTDFFALACAVAAPVGYALSVVWLRQQTTAREAPDVAAVVALQAAFAAGLLGTVGLPLLMIDWRLPAAGFGPALLLQIGALGALATAGYLAFAAAVKRLPAGRVAVIEYTGLVWAAVLGWLWFAERPTAWDAAGAALVIAGCLRAARR